MENFTGKSFIVTGGASGIGGSLVKMLAEAGANVTIADLNAPAPDSDLADISKFPGKVEFVRTDVSDEDSVRSMVDSTVRNFGKLDGACNSAGVASCSKLPHEMSLADWDRVMNINLRGLFLCNKYEITAMLETGGGSIVNVASSCVLAAFPNGSDYCASKSGVAGFTRGAAIDYATKGIRLNVLLPGGTRTPILENAMKLDPGLGPALAAVHPMNRFGEPHEVASCARWLLSGESTFATGALFTIDGGHTVI